MYDPSQQYISELSEQEFQEQIRDLVREFLPRSELKEVIRVMLAKAKDGDVEAAKLIWHMIVTTPGHEE